MPEHGDTIRLVPRDQDPLDDTMELVDEQQWEETDAGDENSPVWSLPDLDATVRYVPDAATDVEFFVVEGKDRTAAAKVLEDKIDMLEPGEFKDYLGEFHSADGVRQGLYTVATAAPEASDAAVVKLLSGYLEDDDPLTRRTVLVAMGITRWKDFIDPIERVRNDDPDEKVRKGAEAALQALGKA